MSRGTTVHLTGSQLLTASLLFAPRPVVCPAHEDWDLTVSCSMVGAPLRSEADDWEMGWLGWSAQRGRQARGISRETSCQAGSLPAVSVQEPRGYHRVARAWNVVEVMVAVVLGAQGNEDTIDCAFPFALPTRNEQSTLARGRSATPAWRARPRQECGSMSETWSEDLPELMG